VEPGTLLYTILPSWENPLEATSYLLGLVVGCIRADEAWRVWLVCNNRLLDLTLPDDDQGKSWSML